MASRDNEALTAARPAIGPVIQSLGLRLKRAFTNPIPTPPPAETISESELSRVIFIAAGAESRVHHGTDYRNTSERIMADLNAAKAELENAVQKFKPQFSTNRGVQNEQDIAFFTLARINSKLGNYDEAERIYKTLCPPISSCAPVSQRTVHTTGDTQAHEMEIMLAYLVFLANTARHLEFAESLGDHLLSTKTYWSAEDKCRVRLALVEIYNTQSNFALASERLRLIEALNPPVLFHIQISVSFYLNRAVSLAGLGQQSSSRQNFVTALVRSAVVLGMWHSTTLSVLYSYGKALKKWGAYEAAASLLGECCLGNYHRCGTLHPLSKRSYTELEMCQGSRPQLDTLHRFNDPTSGDETKLSVAYEHIYLNNVIDLLVSAGETCFDKVEGILQGLIDDMASLKVDTAEHGATFVLRIHRALARCKFEEGKREEAIQSVVRIDTEFKRSVEGTLQSSLDLIMFYNADSSTKSEAIELSRAIFFDVDVRLNRDQAWAYHRKLSALNTTHFTYESVVNNPLPITVLENVGTGAYATVESIEIGSRLYARKSIALPRYSQNRIRQTIQNEISVIRALAHPHIVEVYCTYEEKSRFAIILQPLASCDLEAFIEQHNDASDPGIGHQRLIWKWLRCLANTLAFIHSKGIRHKDIKTRNILVKDFEVIFADFGSSHAFMDEGTSITEGPAFGHTLMYCAPEVVSWANRGRSADVFSLGCVFTEMATSLDNRSISDYYEFRSRETEGHTGETHAYYATLDLVEEWFVSNSTSLEVLSLYMEVVKPMLDKNAGSRPTASNASDAIQACFKHRTGEFLTTCSKCFPMQWDSAPDDATIIPNAYPEDEVNRIDAW